MTLDLNQIIEASTEESFKENLKKEIESKIIEEERLSVYHTVALQLYGYDEYKAYAIDTWHLGLEQINHPSLDSITRAEFLKNYGLMEMELNQFDLALHYLHQAEEILGELDQSILIDIHFGLSQVYRYLTQLPQAIEYGQKAIELSHKMGDDFEISRAYLNSANLFSKENRYNQAQEAYEKALQYAHTNEVKANIVMSFGLLYQNILEYQKAEEMFQKTEELFVQLGFTNELFELYINYGILYSKLAQFNEAEEYLEKAQNYFLEREDHFNTLSCSLNLGRLEQNRANFTKALEHFNHAIELCNRDPNLISMRTLLYYSRANIFQTLKENEKALDDYHIALIRAKEENDRAMEASIKNGIAGRVSKRYPIWYLILSHYLDILIQKINPFHPHSFTNIFLFPLI